MTIRRVGVPCVGALSVADLIRAPGVAAAADWWDPNSESLCVWAAYQPKGAASFAASLTDLSGNGNDAGDPGGAATPGWDAVNGWTFDGANDYLTTTFVPANDQSQSAIVQFTGCAISTRSIFGMNNGANKRFRIMTDFGGATVLYSNGGNANQAPQLIAGNLAIAGSQGYRNGVADGAAIGAWGGATALTVYIGAENNGAAALLFSGNIQALAIYDCALTAGQVSAVATAMAAL